MTTIKTICDNCGDVELTPDEIALELEPSEDHGHYVFDCPSCGSLQRRPANPRVVSILLATGVAYRVLRPEPITEDEIRRFAEALNREVDPFRLLTG
ncbi:MAG: hypothetical protein KatS3mg011_1952 [Acidimicrobiia bacterium]|jgi:predicted RNA-binding Zn-ribbon protein involved in translation (DUF1610 family)|nr:MAG: hypothetical protein KatS3mg011_1952 [Acidimicrobiia bacterium]